MEYMTIKEYNMRKTYNYLYIEMDAIISWYRQNKTDMIELWLYQFRDHTPVIQKLTEDYIELEFLHLKTTFKPGQKNTRLLLVKHHYGEED